MKYFFPIGLLLSILVPFTYAMAHGEGGAFEKEVGEYLIDVDYPVSEIVRGVPTYFNARLLEKGNKNPAALTNVEVIITENGKQVFSGNIYKQPEKASAFTYTFENPGPHELHAVYFLNGQELARAAFPFEVKKEEIEARPWNFFTKEVLVSSILALMLGWFLANFIRFYGRNN